MKTYSTQLFINNEFVDSVSKETFETINPSNKSVITHIANAVDADVNLAVQAAHQAFPSWSRTPGSYRRDILNKLACLMEEDHEYLSELEALDGGKLLSQVKAVDLPQTIDTFRYFAGWADKFSGEQINSTLSSSHIGITYNEPIGVILCILPFNFPLLMFAWKVAAALSVGCTVVVKPNEKTSLSCLHLCKLLLRTSIPPGVVNVLTGFGHRIGRSLVTHPLVKKVSFTGSLATSKIIQKQLLESDGHLKRLTLELGGKSALLILPDADLEEAVRVSLKGIFFNNGQCCIASSRVFVPEGMYERYLELLKEGLGKRTVGDNFDLRGGGRDHGPVIDKTQWESIERYVKVAEECGKTKVWRGERGEEMEEGYFVAPTILVDVPEESVCAKEEIFGPVLCVFRYGDEKEVVEKINEGEFGLGAGIVGKDIKRIMRLTREIQAGTIYVNDYNVFSAAFPFGGVKNSGIGRELSHHVLRSFTEVKTVVININ